MNNSICTLFDNILIDIHKFKSLRYEELLSPCIRQGMLLIMRMGSGTYASVTFEECNGE